MKGVDIQLALGRLVRRLFGGSAGHECLVDDAGLAVNIVGVEFLEIDAGGSFCGVPQTSADDGYGNLQPVGRRGPAVAHTIGSERDHGSAQGRQPVQLTVVAMNGRLIASVVVQVAKDGEEAGATCLMPAMYDFTHRCIDGATDWLACLAACVVQMSAT